jgi:undecaprenyl-diphosphatase
MSFLYLLEGIRNPVFDFLFSIITILGEETVFMAVGLIVFWCFSKYQGYYLLCSGFFGTLINQFLKIVCRVPRPWVLDPNFTIVESAREAATGYSFPSGHTQSSVGLFGGIARANKQLYIKIAMIALCVLVPLSRMYLGVHTPADVLVSIAIATLIIFVAYPLFRRAESSPRVMYAILGTMLALVVAYVCFVCLYQFPADVYLPENVHNLEEARKNGMTLLGCMLGFLVVYTVDFKFSKFSTKAVWWAQIIKCVVGLGLVLAVKELTKSPLEALCGNALVARAVRYFLVAVIAGAVWPLTFKFFAKLGKKEQKA